MRRLVLFGCGLLFGVGLAVSRMAHPEVVLDFLQLEDLGLLLTMGAALGVCLPAYALSRARGQKPLMAPAFERFPPGFTADHLVGGVIFGVGWGLSGVCPGAAFASLGAGNGPILLALLGMGLGAYLEGLLAGSRRAPAGPRRTTSVERA